MDSARKHWEILQQVPEEFANKVQSFMVIGKKGEGVLLTTDDGGQGCWLGEMRFEEESRKSTGPTRLDIPNLASMAHGDTHILLLDESGQCYAMGQNDRGQLGLGTVDQETRFSPQPISGTSKFVSVRCGHEHSLALTEDGKVWAWGRNKYGQVGVAKSTAKRLPTPRQIPELNPHRVVAVECGGLHSLALTDQGEVYAWGSNCLGQLGDGSGRSKYTPTRISTSSPVKSMAAGLNHTLLSTQAGEVYACGSNVFGELDHPSHGFSRYSVRLVKVDGLPSISHVASHFETYLSIAMTAERKCFVWGQLGDNTSCTPVKMSSNYSTLNSVLSIVSTSRNTPCSVWVKGLQCPMKTQTESLTGEANKPNV